MAVLGLRFCVRAFSSSDKRGPLFIMVCGPPHLLQPLLLRSTGSRCAGSIIVAHGPSCSAAYGIFPDQGSNPCPLHWQADSQPLCHQGSPGLSILFTFSKNQLLVLLVFATVSFICLSFISDLIFMITFLLLTLGFFVLLSLIALGVRLGCLFEIFLVIEIGLYCYKFPS